MLKSKFVIAALLLSTIALPVLAAKPATLKCPACGMPMPMKKTAMMSVPVYSKEYKTVYYCCPMCKAGKAAAAYYKAHHKPMPV